MTLQVSTNGVQYVWTAGVVHPSRLIAMLQVVTHAAADTTLVETLLLTANIRAQPISAVSCTSSASYLKYGVLQGSVPSPLLFIV